MNHTQIQEKLSAFYDRALPEQESRVLADHIQSCSECQAILARWNALRTTLSRAAEPVSSDHFVRAVMNRIAALEEPVTTVSESLVSRFLKNWLAPLAWYGFAFSFLFAVIFNTGIAQTTELNTESLLLTSVSQKIAWTFSEQTPEVTTLFDTKEDI